MAEDFIGSIAQEDVKFTTEVIQGVALGENYSRLMIFVEANRYIVSDSDFVNIISVNFNNYNSIKNAFDSTRDTDNTSVKNNYIDLSFTLTR